MKLTRWVGAMLVALAFTPGLGRAQSDEIPSISNPIRCTA